MSAVIIISIATGVVLATVILVTLRYINRRRIEIRRIEPYVEHTHIEQPYVINKNVRPNKKARAVLQGPKPVQILGPESATARIKPPLRTSRVA